MALKIVRNDITKMNTEAVVNTANQYPLVGRGCDEAIYNAAGFDDLLNYRKEYIGEVEEGNAFITPGFALEAKYIIHAVSPLFIDGNHHEETKLRACYQNSLKIALEKLGHRHQNIEDDGGNNEGNAQPDGIFAQSGLRRCGAVFAKEGVGAARDGAQSALVALLHHDDYGDGQGQNNLDHTGHNLRCTHDIRSSKQSNVYFHR